MFPTRPFATFKALLLQCHLFTTTAREFRMARRDAIIAPKRPSGRTLLMAIVLHSALFGAYSKYNSIPVPGLVGALTPTTLHGVYVDLNDYFNGDLASSNIGTDQGEAVNFFDDGGEAVALETSSPLIYTHTLTPSAMLPSRLFKTTSVLGQALYSPAVANATLLGNYTKAPIRTTSLNTSTIAGTSTPAPTTNTAVASFEHLAMGLQWALTVGGTAAFAFGVM
ncbi:hypothetical protein BJ170DRAFT_723699 [Xylariales sp. AK1849]|nr:hypothetical protein BJ170DRAFT_723699 [Xylariales sp. AK1849]